MAKTAKGAAKGKGGNAPTPEQVHAKVASLLSGKALTGEAAEAFVADAFKTAASPAVTAGKPVSFTCDNFGCLVGITSGNIHFVFSGTGGANFPVGVSRIFYAVQGPPNQAFSIAVQGSTLDFPIADQLTPNGIAGGRRFLTVP